MATDLLDMFHAECKGRRVERACPLPSSAAAAANDSSLPLLTRVAGGVQRWSRAVKREVEDFATPEELTNFEFGGGQRWLGEEGGAASAFAEGEEQDGSTVFTWSETLAAGEGTAWRAEMDQKTGRLRYAATAA